MADKYDLNAAVNPYAPKYDLSKAVNPYAPTPAQNVIPRGEAVDLSGIPQKGQAEPVLPYLKNEAIKGVASLPALVPFAADVVNIPLRPYARALGLSNSENKNLVQFPATEAYNAALQKAGVYREHMAVPKDAQGWPSFPAEVAGKIAEVAGMNAIPGLGVVARSTQPVVALAKELAGTVAAGEGMVMGGNVVQGVLGDSPRNQAVGEIVGSMTGPMLVHSLIEGAVAGGNWASKTADKFGVTLGLSKAARDSARDAQAKKVVQSELASQLGTSEARATIAKSEQLASRIPGFGENLTLGRITGSPNVKSTEHHFASTVPELQELAHQREQGLRRAIEEYSAKRFPSTTPASALSEIKSAYQSHLKRLDTGLKRLDNKERVLAQGLPRGDIDQIGFQARNLVVERLGLARAQKDLMYRAVDEAAAKAGVTVDLSDVVSLAKSSASGAARTFQDDPTIIGKVLRQYGALASPKVVQGERGTMTLRGGTEVAPTRVPFSEFQSLFRESNLQARRLKIAANAGDMNASQQLPQVEGIRDLLGTKLNEMASPRYGAVGAKLKEANDFYRDTYAKSFKQGVGAEVLKNGSFGSATENANIMKSLVFKKGDPSGVREFLSVVGDDPRGVTLLENGVFDMLAKETVRDGKMSKVKLDTFLRDYKESLAEIPAVRGRIENVSSALSAIRDNTSKVLAARSELASGTLKKMAGEEHSSVVFSKALKSPEYLQSLLANTSTLAKEDVARGMVDLALKSRSAPDFLKTNEEALRKALGATQFGHLQTIVGARKIAESVIAPPFVQYQKPGDILRRYGTTIPQVQSDIKGVIQGRAGSEHLATLMATRVMNKFNNASRDKLLQAAIFDPELAKAIVNYAKVESGAAKAKFNEHLAAHGIRMLAAVTLGQQEQK